VKVNREWGEFGDAGGKSEQARAAARARGRMGMRRAPEGGSTVQGLFGPGGAPARGPSPGPFFFTFFFCKISLFRISFFLFLFLFFLLYSFRGTLPKVSETFWFQIIETIILFTSTLDKKMVYNKPS